MKAELIGEIVHGHPPHPSTDPGRNAPNLAFGIGSRHGA
jgi:hypothetical protein